MKSPVSGGELTRADRAARPHSSRASKPSLAAALRRANVAGSGNRPTAEKKGLNRSLSLYFPNRVLYFRNEETTLTPAPSDGWVFDHWEGDASGTDSPLHLTMNTPKEVTAVFKPFFNIQVDINDDGDWTNDDEFEPGGTDESEYPLGEFMRTDDRIDNGLGFAPIWTTWFHQGPEPESEEYYRCDDLQPLRIAASTDALATGVFSLTAAQVLDSLRFYRSTIISSSSHNEVTFPYNTAEEGPLPATLYMLADESIEHETTFDLTLTRTDGDSQTSDTVKFTVAPKLGLPHYLNGAFDYIAESETKIFVDEYTCASTPPETYDLVIIPHPGARMGVIDPYFGSASHLYNIFDVEAAYPQVDVIVNGLNFDENYYTTMAPKIMGWIASNGVVGPYSLMHWDNLQNELGSPAPEKKNFIIQKDSSSEIRIGKGTENIHEQPYLLNVYQNGVQIPTEGIVDIPAYVNSPQSWTPNPYTCNYEQVVFGLESASLSTPVKPNNYIGLGQASDGRKAIIIGTSRVQGAGLGPWSYKSRRGSKTQPEVFMTKLASSGVPGDTLFRFDGGGSSALAIRTKQGEWKTLVYSLRHAAQLFGYCNNYVSFTAPSPSPSNLP